ncbi:MAG: polyprenyl synthetase family protein [Chlorobiales bacterium]|nr:polyprenyl synthetase family protein [Chlorobiales bacterium]
MGHDTFFQYLKDTDAKIKQYFRDSETKKHFRPSHIYDGVLSYLLRPAKRLRPAMMMLSCGCLSGTDKIASILPAAAGIELFHTWTLVHDDIIDNDHMRRGQNTVHVDLMKKGKNDLDLNDEEAEEYGRSIAILTGDVQHGWVVSAFVECALTYDIDPVLVLTLIKHLETEVLDNLIYGEVLDVQFSLQDFPEQITIDEEQVLKMEWLKTGVLYEFAAAAGAMMGKETTDFDDPDVRALAGFASNCGIAFQLQDDILGIVGDEKQLGKPIGSDIREGKKTTIVLQALKNADSVQNNRILSVLGNRSANDGDIAEIISLFNDLGGIEYTRKLASSYLDKALPRLHRIEESKFKDLLYSWADFMINREL